MMPLIAETLGKIGEETSFRVDLRPNLTYGRYNFTRAVEIDPNEQWFRYGQEIIGTVNVLEDNSDILVNLIKTVAESIPDSSGSSGSSSDSSGEGTKEKKVLGKEPTSKVADTGGANKDAGDKQGDLSGITGAIVGSSGLDFFQNIFVTLFIIVVITSFAWFISRRK